VLRLTGGSGKNNGLTYSGGVINTGRREWIWCRAGIQNQPYLATDRKQSERWVDGNATQDANTERAAVQEHQHLDFRFCNLFEISKMTCHWTPERSDQRPYN
jgi:hypothetical protein